MTTQAVVLATVNAPYSARLSATELAYYLQNPAAAVEAAPGHMSSFFGDVLPEHQLAFAEQSGVPRSVLVATANAFAAYSGESYPLAT
jgi:hypothetical protein